MSKIGHNSNLTENERKALLFYHMAKQNEVDAKLDELKATRKSLRKTAQADGIVLADLDFAIKAIAMEDKQAVIEGEKSRCNILSWLNLIPGYQPDLFTDRAPALERIEGEGERAGLLGKDGVSPYLKNSEDDEAWLKGWRKGQDILAKDLLSAREKLGPSHDNDDDPFPDDDFADDAA